MSLFGRRKNKQRVEIVLDQDRIEELKDLADRLEFLTKGLINATEAADKTLKEHIRVMNRSEAEQRNRIRR